MQASIFTLPGFMQKIFHSLELKWTKSFQHQLKSYLS